jgi:PPOX class probable F420-dependent enzyme
MMARGVTTAEEEAMALDEDTARLAKSTSLATVVTLMPSGQPQAQLTWIDHDGEHILVNTEPQRQRGRNIERDPRITVLIHSSENGYDWSEIRGRVTETIGGDRARAHIDELSNRYTGHDYAAPVGPQGRIILVVTPEKINTPKTMGRR